MAYSSTLPIVAIIGRANVGKSTLFNRLVGARQAITHDSPGTTRDANYGVVDWGGKYFMLVDTAGLHKADKDELDIGIQEQINEVASLAECIIVAVDSTTMLTIEDKQAAKLSLKTGKPVIVAAGKSDTAGFKPVDRLESLGIKTVVQVSALQGIGTGTLLDEVINQLPAKTKAPDEANMKLALVGRPNVGKSSLLNSLIGKQTSHVSEVAGTTRDTNQYTIKFHGETITLIDTAGLRRRGKIEQGIEQFSAIRTLEAITQADVCALVIDATEPRAANDQHIAGMVLEAGKGLMLVINKWDLIEKDDKTQAYFLRTLQSEYAFAPWAPVVFTSATQGLHVTKLFELTREITGRRETEITTGELNRVITKLETQHPPAGLKNRHPKLLYATQTGTQPPTFTIFCKHEEFIHFSYRRYIENGLREVFDFDGTPIKVIFRDKGKKG